MGFAEEEHLSKNRGSHNLKVKSPPETSDASSGHDRCPAGSQCTSQGCIRSFGRFRYLEVGEVALGLEVGEHAAAFWLRDATQEASIALVCPSQRNFIPLFQTVSEIFLTLRESPL